MSGSASLSKNSAPEVSLSAPTYDGVIHAVDELQWSGVSSLDLADILQKTPERAAFRFQKRMANLIFNDAKLEGNTFTEPEVQTLLDGTTVAGRPEDEANQIIALSEGADLLLTSVSDGSFVLGKDFSDSLHGLIAPFEAIEAGHFRGEGSVTGGGRVNVMGDQFAAPASDDGGEKLREIYADGLDRLSEIQHPVVRGTAYAAFAAYYQFYFDGNKRTSRYVMNGELMSNGFDAIVTPFARRAEYNRALAAMYKTGDATEYILFTLSCYDRS
jgi:Fic family protein